MRTIFCIVVAIAISIGFATAGLAQDADLDAYFDAAYGPDYEMRMVDRIAGQIDRYLDGYNERVTAGRDRHWDRNLSSWSAYVPSVNSNRARLRELLGAVDEREDVQMEVFGKAVTSEPGLLAEREHHVVRRVRWPILDGITGEGLLLTPTSSVKARVVAIPDADQRPEELAGLISGGTDYARTLADAGIEVIVPVLINRETTFSGAEDIILMQYWLDAREPAPRYTNETHREWVYRHAYPLGRHIIGYEIQKVAAALDWFEQRGDEPMGVAGYGEGGLISFYAAAIDTRISSTLVSGYFGPRERVWEEPIYRNVWGLLTEFGDAEIASLVAPRRLVIEYSEAPETDGPPPAKGSGRGSSAAAPGHLWTPSCASVRSEVERLEGFFAASDLRPDVAFIHDGCRTVPQMSRRTLEAFARGLEIDVPETSVQPVSGEEAFDRDAQQRRQIRQITDHLQRSVHDWSDFRRYQFLQGDLSSPAAWHASMEPYREAMYDELIGDFGEPPIPIDARRRKVFDEEKWIGYEVIMDVLPGVYGWGLLAIPKDIQEGERRPVMVVQHGHAGIPTTPVRIESYNNILPKLVARGFIVFAPHNPYQFNVRKATPLKATAFSALIPQHQQLVRYLATLDEVDADRIGFYGKSWGGRSALRITPYVPEYRFAICAAFFNNWARKQVDTRFHHSTIYNASYSLYEWNQHNTFTHAEMAKLIAPRPFMVENGYRDPVMPDEWAGYEFAKVKRLYERLGIADRAVFGTHIGGHEVHDDTILPFIHKHLQWPVRAVE